MCLSNPVERVLAGPEAALTVWTSEVPVLNCHCSSSVTEETVVYRCARFCVEVCRKEIMVMQHAVEHEHVLGSEGLPRSRTASSRQYGPAVSM